MNLYMNVLINTIIQYYFLNSRCIIMFTDEFNSVDYNGNIPIVNIKIELASEIIPTEIIFHYFGCQEIVVKSGRPLWILKMFEREIRLGMERFNSRKYLFVAGYNMIENITDILQLEEIRYVSDLIIIEQYEQKIIKRKRFLPEEEVMYNLWTHKYIGNSDNNEKLLLDVWFSKNQSFMYNRNLYPNKLINQMGRQLKLANFHYEPYTIIGSTPEDSHGFELLTAIMFTKKLNMTPVIVVDQEDYWGEIYENWTGYGLLGNLVTDKADIGFTSVAPWEEDYHYLDLSRPTVRTGVTSIVPAPKLASGWLTPLHSFSSEMWVAVGIMFIVCIISLSFIQCFYAKSKFSSIRYRIDQKSTTKLLGRSIFTIIRLFFIQVVPDEELPRGLIGTCFMSLLFVLNLFLVSTYSSGLSAIMTVPRYDPPINSVTELAKSGINWGGTQEGWIYSIESYEEPAYRAIVRKFVTTTEENLREYSKTGQFGFAVERLPHKNYAIGAFIKEDVIGNFHLMKEDVYWAHIVMMTRKNSILLNLLDTFISTVSEAGLISYWQSEAASVYMNSKVQRAVKFSDTDRISNHKVEKLKWIQVEGAFGILCAGYIISLIVFLIEILINKLKHSSLYNKIFL